MIVLNKDKCYAMCFFSAHYVRKAVKNLSLILLAKILAGYIQEYEERCDS